MQREREAMEARISVGRGCLLGIALGVALWALLALLAAILRPALVFWLLGLWAHV